MWNWGCKQTFYNSSDIFIRIFQEVKLVCCECENVMLKYIFILKSKNSCLLYNLKFGCNTYMYLIYLTSFNIVKEQFKIESDLS